jgi:transposase-like protein
MTGKEEMILAGKRRKFSGEDKVRILKRHLVDKVPVSDLCDEQGLHPTMFYKWQKEFFENGAAAFERKSDAQSRRLEKENTALKTKIAHKDEVIAEIMESHVALKKSLGES